MRRLYQELPVAALNAIAEDAALIADTEADRLDRLAGDMTSQIAVSPRRGLKWRLDEYKAGSRVARRIAASIRSALIHEEEEG
jgi:hypothetical protein